MTSIKNSHVIEETRHQNNVNTERLHQQRNVYCSLMASMLNFLRFGPTNVEILGRDM